MSALTSLKSRFSDPARWKKAGFETLVFFTLGLAVCTSLSLNVQGRLLYVGTPSIPLGFYWQDNRPKNTMTGEFITFRYDQMPDYIKGRYDDGSLHTKMVKGTSGYTVSVDVDGIITMCTPALAAEASTCEAIGHVEERDSRNRPLKSWVPVGTRYELQPGEIWVHGTNVRSLDSRYHGPIDQARVIGHAKQLLTW